MAEEEPTKTVESETTPLNPVAPATKTTETLDDVSETDKPEKTKELVLVEEVVESGDEKTKTKTSHGSINRDTVLAKVETEKRMSLIRAWEESEKSKAENKAQKQISAIGAWENTKKASVEAELKRIEEELERKKAGFVEKMKNKIALFHKAAEEKRAVVEAKRGQDVIKAEETAAKYRASGTAPKRLLLSGCF